MASDADWMMRPVLKGMVKYESLLDCSLDLGDLAECNDALDAQLENERRARMSRK